MEQRIDGGKATPAVGLAVSVDYGAWSTWDYATGATKRTLPPASGCRS